ncbi:MAG: hypothetical protein C0441_05310 [Comamonadaceae bacterium]|nr:hypothetical protein [Comamonadaceae bacterium]
MTPFLPFIVGLFAGAAAVSAARSERARVVFNDSGTRLRQGLEQADAVVRAAASSSWERLYPAPCTDAAAQAAPSSDAAPAAPQPEAPPATLEPAAPSPAKPRRRRTPAAAAPEPAAPVRRRRAAATAATAPAAPTED